MNKTPAAILTAVILSLAGLAGGMLHAQANQGQNLPTWDQAVITVDDKATADAAQNWDAPQRIVYVATGADVHVERLLPGGRVAGEAKRTVENGHIVACHIDVQAGEETVAVLAHEMGHCLGLWGHAMTPTSLMHAETGRPGVSALDVTDADRDALALLYATR